MKKILKNQLTLDNTIKIAAVFEFVLNALDVGIIVEIIRNAMKYKTDMEPLQFVKLLFFGKGYNELTPPQLTMKMRKEKLLIIDFRDDKDYEKNHIKGSILEPFDDFLRDIFEDIKYRTFKERYIILVCRTGNMSRVAGAVLAENGFDKVYNVKRGMRRWNRWARLYRYCS